MRTNEYQDLGDQPTERKKNSAVFLAVAVLVVICASALVIKSTQLSSQTRKQIQVQTNTNSENSVADGCPKHFFAPRAKSDICLPVPPHCDGLDMLLQGVSTTSIHDECGNFAATPATIETNDNGEQPVIVFGRNKNMLSSHPNTWQVYNGYNKFPMLGNRFTLILDGYHLSADHISFGSTCEKSEKNMIPWWVSSFSPEEEDQETPFEIDPTDDTRHLLSIERVDNDLHVYQDSQLVRTIDLGGDAGDAKIFHLCSIGEKKKKTKANMRLHRVILSHKFSLIQLLKLFAKLFFRFLTSGIFGRGFSRRNRTFPRFPTCITSITTENVKEEVFKILIGKEAIELDPEYVTLLQTINTSTNSLLLNHSNFFKNSTNSFGFVYQIGVDDYTLADTPPGLAYNVSSAVGYGLANSILLVNGNGVVLIDSGIGDKQVGKVIDAFVEKGVLASSMNIPLKAIIYTHNHIDHTGGSEFWLDHAKNGACDGMNDKKDGTFYANDSCVEVICQEIVVNSVINTGTRTGQQIDARSAYMYGTFSAQGAINNGIGPPDPFQNATFHPPTKTFTNDLKVFVNGMILYLKYAPSETSDEIIIFAPDKDNLVLHPIDSSLYGTTNFTEPVPPQDHGPGLLASAEVIQGPSFPNLYSLRGTTFRNPLTWYQSVDILRKFTSWCMVPSHGVPIMGNKNVQQLLINFRDAIQHVHDQTLRFIRKGHIPDELVTMVDLPPYILNNLMSLQGLPTNATTPTVNPRDYLRTFYGSVPQSVRELFAGYLGWNQGDPTFFQPLPPKKRANRYVRQMGGVRRIIRTANRYYQRGVQMGDKSDFQWAAELLTYVLRSSRANIFQINRARILKGKAFLRLAQTKSTNEAVLEADWWSLNPNWRNWFVVGAEELGLRALGLAFPAGAALNSPEIQSGLPPGFWVQQWCWRYNSENITLNGTKFGWEFAANVTYWGDKPQRFVLDVAQEVVRFISDNITLDKIWDDVGLKVLIDHPTFAELIKSDTSFSKQKKECSEFTFRNALFSMVQSGKIVALSGSAEDIADFYDPTNFDAVPGVLPAVVDR